MGKTVETGQASIGWADTPSMEIVFFTARPEDAISVASSDDLPGDFAAEPLAVEGPSGLLGLSVALGLGRR
jgi:hypothetical protein